MKKALVFVLVLALALTMGIIAFAEGVTEDEEIVAEEIVEAVEEPAEEPVEEPAEEPAEEAIEEPVEEPAETASEDSELEAWMASLNPSWGVSEEEWKFCYTINNVLQYYYEDGALYENFGTESVTLTVKTSYVVHAELTPEEGQALVDAMREDPDISAPYVEIASETVTIEIPAGESVFVPKNAELITDGVYSGQYVCAATYKGVSASIE
ncbi:MAG: hypothetical protein J1E00_07410 [Oscillospiraceae bacterium]|nr:hypothetical protein [Oscillospiraceae bacterium]